MKYLEYLGWGMAVERGKSCRRLEALKLSRDITEGGTDAEFIGGDSPTPTQAGMVSNCNGFHRVGSGDTCYDIAAEAGIWIIQLYAWNPAVGTDCSGSWLGYHVCISVID